MRQIDFGWLLSHGSVLNTAECWKSPLEETRDAISGGDDFTQDEKDIAMESIDSLSSRITAKKASKEASAAFRYIYEERLRAIICLSLEDMMPFPWTCTWGQDKMNEVFKVLHRCFSSITNSESRILRNTPASVVAAVLETFVNGPGSTKLSWWEENDKFDMLVGKANRACTPAGCTALESIPALIKDCLSLFRHDVLSITNVSERQELGESRKILSVIRRDAKQRSDNPCSTENPGEAHSYLYLSTGDILEISNLVRNIVPIYSIDWNCKALLAEERMKHGDADNIDKLYWLIRGKKGTSSELCIYADTLLEDIGIMLNDLMEVVRKIRRVPWPGFYRPELYKSMVDMGMPKDGDERHKQYIIRIFQFLQGVRNGVKIDEEYTDHVVDVLLARLNHDGTISEDRVCVFHFLML